MSQRFLALQRHIKGHPGIFAFEPDDATFQAHILTFENDFGALGWQPIAFVLLVVSALVAVTVREPDLGASVPMGAVVAPTRSLR